VSFRDEPEGKATWKRSGEGILGKCVTDSYITSPVFLRDGAYEALIRADKETVASLVLRSTRHATSCYLVSLDYARGRIGFYRKFHGEPKEVIQERRVSLRPGETHCLRVVTTGEFFEIYLDGCLSIVRADYTYKEGCWGLHSGPPGAHFSKVRVEERCRQPL
jgi:hypothetical protein